MNDCVLRNNTALSGGGVYIMTSTKLNNNWRIRILNTNFIENQGMLTGQALFDYGNLDLHNVSIQKNHSTGTGDMYIEGENIAMSSIHMKIGSVVGTIQTNMVYYGLTVAAPHITLHDNINFSCPVFFRVDVHSAVTYAYSMLSIQCHSCEAGKYTILEPTVQISTISSNFSVPQVECLPCELGSICKGNVRSVDNYWGTNISIERLEFWPCPAGYCCSSQTSPCQTWNTCRERREGVLCGSCKAGYVQSYISGDCIPEVTECGTDVFLVYFVLLSFVYTIVFTFMRAIVETTKHILSSITKKNKSNKDGDVEVAIQEANDTPVTSEKPPLPIGAFVTLIMFFYQVASLVHVKILEVEGNSGVKEDHNVGEDSIMLRETLFEFANFQLVVSNTLYPMENLTILTKEFVNIGLKVSSFFNLLIFLIISVIYVKCKGCNKHDKKDGQVEEIVSMKSTENFGNDYSEEGSSKATKSNANTNDESHHLNVPSMLKIGFIKLVKLNFTAVSKFSFQMVHCVPILGTFHLYVYGDYLCYKWWQHLILFFVIPTLLTIPLSFSKSLDLLKGGFISTNIFLLGMVIPPFGLGLYLKNQHLGSKKLIYSAQEEVCIKEILEGEEFLFKEQSKKSNDENDKTKDQKLKCESQLLRWPIVQLYRNILIVVLKLFILTPIYRSIAFATVFAGFVAHDWYVKPYKHPYLNFLQLTSSGFLLLFAICNNPPSISYLGKISDIPHTSSVISVVQGVEMLLLVVAPLSLPIWLAWEKYEEYLRGYFRQVTRKMWSQEVEEGEESNRATMEEQ